MDSHDDRKQTADAGKGGHSLGLGPSGGATPSVAPLGWFGRLTANLRRPVTLGELAVGVAVYSFLEWLLSGWLS